MFLVPVIAVVWVSPIEFIGTSSSAPGNPTKTLTPTKHDLSFLRPSCGIGITNFVSQGRKQVQNYF